MTKNKSSEEVLASATSGTAEGALSSAAATHGRVETMSLEDALASLDPDDDSQWTSDGLPRMEVLESLTGGNLTRADVDGAASGFTREKARIPADAGGPNDAGPVSHKQAGLESRVAELEADNAFLRKQFGWPTRN